MKSKPLKHFKVLDLTHRLPGPLAGHLLQDLGAQVIKVEDENFGDPFLDGFFKKMDPSFSHWYQSLNDGKNIQRFSLKENIQRLKEFIQNADIVLMGLPFKLQQSLGVTFEEMSNERAQNSPVVFLEMIGSHDSSKGMHDLNALAQSRLLDLYLYEVTHLDPQISPERIAPPFLPFAGIGYGAMISNMALGSLLKAKEEKCSQKEIISLEESVNSLLGPFYSPELEKTGQKTFLHNGRYPCYNIYPLADKGHLAVACLEPKYWQRFCDLLGLNLKEEQRFEFQDKTIFKTIQKKASELTYSQALELFNDQDCCVDLIGASGT